MNWLAARLMWWLWLNVARRREPDFVIGDPHDPYLKRWWLIPRNPLVNVYLHQILRSDEDRALHDHPWAFLSLMLAGSYIEHTIRPGGIHVRREHLTGSLRLRLASTAHRLEVPPTRWCWTLVITGPRYRRWGFHCPERGWVHWRKFTDPATGGATVGRGCEP